MWIPPFGSRERIAPRLFRVRIALSLRKKERAVPKPFVMNYFREQGLKRNESGEPTAPPGSDRGVLYGATGLRVAKSRRFWQQ
jgi:hypothetical protein